MKKSVQYFPLFLIIAILIFGGCKKYPEGPSLSLLTKKERVTNDWVIDKYFVDDTDNTQAYRNVFSKSKLSINRDGSYQKETVSEKSTTVTKGKWHFGYKHYTLVFNEISITQNSNQKVANAEHSNEILKLKRIELWFRETTAGHRYTYYYKPE
jgi:hypothetical protein